MRVGVFGGTFDPVHYGHLLLAECCREQRRLDRVLFLPAAAPPHKLRDDLTPGRERIEMLRLAVGGHEAFEVDDREVRRGGVSYTVETLRELSAQRPADELFLLLGADMLADLPNWREPAEVCRLATPVAVGRSGGPPIDFSRLDPLVTPQRRDQIARSAVEMPLVDLSSTQLRRRVADGQSIRYRTPPAVEQYIAAHGLYRAAPADQTE